MRHRSAAVRCLHGRNSRGPRSAAKPWKFSLTMDGFLTSLLPAPDASPLTVSRPVHFCPSHPNRNSTTPHQNNTMKTHIIACLTAASLLGGAALVRAQEIPQMPPPVKEHTWLEQLAGEWESEME